jgi:hypothetical protein
MELQYAYLLGRMNRHKRNLMLMHQPAPRRRVFRDFISLKSYSLGHLSGVGLPTCTIGVIPAAEQLVARTGQGKKLSDCVSHVLNLDPSERSNCVKY